MNICSSNFQIRFCSDLVSVISSPNLIQFLELTLFLLFLNKVNSLSKIEIKFDRIRLGYVTQIFDPILVNDNRIFMETVLIIPTDFNREATLP